ncbi:MAG: sigma-70 family RNA polymerase sigma factor [Bacteroidales bacterium]|nr:sigma-70 family RNA polymerase sigma factor [Bacteroidales bacterium]
MSDSQLWSELKNGNPEVLNFLFHEFYNDLYFYGTKLINDKNLIIDTIQDIFLNLWEGKKRLSDVQHIKAYLFKIFRNRLLKAPQKNTILFSLEDSNRIPDKEFIISQEDIIIEQETRSQISKTIITVLEELTDKQKEILYLKFYCNLSNTEISQTISIKKQSVSNLLNRSINTFRKKIKNYDLSLLFTFPILFNHL